MENIKILFDFLKNNEFDKFKNYFQLNKHIDVNIRDDAGNYLITYVIIKNNIELIQLLLENECRIDIFDQEERSLLYLPIKYDYIEIVKLLLKYDKHSIGISILDIKDKYNNIPLHYTIFFNNTSILKMLLDVGSDVNIVDNNGNNSLHLAVLNKNYEMCKLILNKDINVNARTNIGENALHIACNFQLEDIVNLLIEHDININAQDFNNEFTPLMYTVSLNNKKLSKILLQNNVDPNKQDFIGNTALHYSILEENYEICDLLLKYMKNTLMTNVNVFNINSELPIHIFLQKDKISDINVLKKLIHQSNLNFQDQIGNTALHLICQKNLWKDFKEILGEKKLNIFIKNNDKQRPIDFIDKGSLDDFFDMIVHSYLFILRNRNFVYKEDWENLCSKELFIDKLSEQELKTVQKYIKNNDKKKDLCYDIILNKLQNIYQNDTNLCSYTSYPIKQSHKCITIKEIDKVELCSFVGTTLDVLIGLLYLLKTYDYACSTITTNFIKNKDLCNYYQSLGFKTKTKCEFMNFEIVWVYQKLFFSENFVDNFKLCLNKKNIRFIIIPLGIEINEGSHANYLIFDKKKYEIERFEPYGSASPYKFNYDSKLLDNVLTYKFNNIDHNIKYISPEKYLPKIGFQYFDVFESKTRKIGDPRGFCALWSIWYTDMRLKYPDIDKTSLVKKLLKEIKMKNISFKNLIRNYSLQITNIRDELLKKVNININEWINDQYTEEQYVKLINEITTLINQYV